MIQEAVPSKNKQRQYVGTEGSPPNIKAEDSVFTYVSPPFA